MSGLNEALKVLRTGPAPSKIKNQHETGLESKLRIFTI